MRKDNSLCLYVSLPTHTGYSSRYTKTSHTLMYVSQPMSMVFNTLHFFQSAKFQSVIFQSCNFHPCNFVRHFPVLQFPVLHIQVSQLTMSGRVARPSLKLCFCFSNKLAFYDYGPTLMIK